MQSEVRVAFLLHGRLFRISVLISESFRDNADQRFCVLIWSISWPSGASKVVQRKIKSCLLVSWKCPSQFCLSFHKIIIGKDSVKYIKKAHSLKESLCTVFSYCCNSVGRDSLLAFSFPLSSQWMVETKGGRTRQRFKLFSQEVCAWWLFGDFFGFEGFFSPSPGRKATCLNWEIKWHHPCIS